MIIAYLKSKQLSSELITSQNSLLLADAVWIDVFNPSKEEDTLLEQCLNIEIPTREEMREIEVSSRFYTENDTVYMTANMLSKSESSEPKNDAITLIYTDDKLMTVRYIEAHSFASFTSRLLKLSPDNYHAGNLVIELLDATIDRLADILEQIGLSLDASSELIFRSPITGNSKQNVDYKKLLQNIGSNGDLSSKVGECLISFNLLISYFGRAAFSKLSDDLKSKLSVLEKDVNSLNNHVNFISGKVNFLLDATLGMVTIEQNDIIKIFSIAAVMFLPPTLIASIYGMNFHFIPELSWHYGYFIAIGLMLISTWLPYKFLKRKKWL